ncbi:MAG: class II fumarate hydratase, partial [Desulfuromonadales bacterium]|nr:class II fumarate hydratase [Desulfuromonadales bacterium]
MSATRTEQDSMGSMIVPSGALYGAQTARARDNFPISGVGFPRPFLRALGMVKEHAAQVNRELGLIDERVALAIMDAAEEVIVGDLDDHFPLDIFQTGSGTSTNMNANEVIANRACQLLDEPLGSRAVHPNDHVNYGQSSNDVIPTAMHLAAAVEINQHLLPALGDLCKTLGKKAREFDDIVTIARTHLQDATPIRLGQIFGGYFRQVTLITSELERAMDGLCELPLGGTAVGTGLNTHPEFAQKVISGLAEVTKLPLREAKDHFAAQAGKGQVVAASGALKTTAVALFKIANDIRFLASGPRCGLGELQLPTVQPGSS